MYYQTTKTATYKALANVQRNKIKQHKPTTIVKLIFFYCSTHM